MRKFVTLLALTLVCLSAAAQKADLRRGNRQFRKGEYAQADISYRKALMQDTSSVVARYNLANNLYRQENYDEAAKQLEGAAKNAAAEPFAADFYFNQGDVAIAREDWQTAVDAFVECLLRTPDDLKAKENYIYARNKLMEQQQQQQQQQQNQNQDQNQDQDQNSDQNQDQNQDQQQDQDSDRNSDQDQKEPPQPEKQQQQLQQVELSPQQAQQLLQAIQEKEKQTQEKVDEKKAQALKSRQKVKNW